MTFLPGHMPAAGAAVTAGFEFDVPVRFDTDRLEINLPGFQHGAIPEHSDRRGAADEDIAAGACRRISTAGATTLCWCWRLTRRDGMRLGFTDHDRDLAFDGTTFEAAAGFTASEMRETPSASRRQSRGRRARCRPSRLDEADLAAGLYDDARRRDLPRQLGGRPSSAC